MARWTTLLVAALAIAALAVGCGGGDDGSTTSDGNGGDSGSAANAESGSSGGSGDGNAEAAAGDGGLETSSLDKDAYVNRASQACSGIRENLLAEVSDYLEKHSSDGLPEPVLIANMAKEVMLPTVEAEIDAVRALGAPEGDEAEIEAILAAQEKAVDQVKGVQRAKTLEEVENHFKAASKQYRDYGFYACTNSS